jgi:hypothetical protein
MTAEAKLRRVQRPQLRVVFDSNILFNGSASDLVQYEAANLIKESTFPDLEIQWYLPELVRHERQYQMQKRALELLPSIAKLERLLGHNLAISEQTLLDGVEKAISQRQEELGLLNLVLDDRRVDWHRVALDAAYRRAPFEVGEKEKGFRDRVIVECFLQLSADSPKTPSVCRIVLVSGDQLVAQAVQSRTAGATNTSVVSSLEELKGLINTLVSQVDESFLELLKPKAKKLFFVPKEESALFYKEQIRIRIDEKFEKELAAPPPGATSRINGIWRIHSPNFVKKTGRRIQWTSRIEVEAEASKPAAQSPTILLSSMMQPASAGNLLLGDSMYYPAVTDLLSTQGTGFASVGRPISLSSLAKSEETGEWVNAASISSTKTHKGVDVYEVLWSADVTTSRDLRRPSVDEIKHVGPTWEQIV